MRCPNAVSLVVAVVGLLAFVAQAEGRSTNALP